MCAAQTGHPALTHYVPLHLSPMGVALGYAPDDLPESKKAYETLLRLPIHEEMTEDQAFFVAGALIRAAEAVTLGVVIPVFRAGDNLGGVVDALHGIVRERGIRLGSFWSRTRAGTRTPFGELSGGERA